MAEDEAGPEETVYVLEEKKVNFTYNLVVFASMPDDTQFECMDMTVTACEKFSNDYGIAAKEIKRQMDKKFQPAWNVIIGEAYGFVIQYEWKYFIHFYCLGTMAALVWKC